VRYILDTNAVSALMKGDFEGEAGDPRREPPYFATGSS
jgi:hypothetical protein